MPQMRAVMSGASLNARPRRNASKKRGGSKICSFDVDDLAVADAHVQRALALDAGEGVGLDRARAAAQRAHAASLSSRNGSARGVEGAEDAHEIALARRRARSTSRSASAVFGVSIGP